MTDATACAANLGELLAKSPAVAPSFPFDPSDRVAVLVHSLLLWEASTPQADKAFIALRDVFIDENDLRVALPHEVVEVIGARYPLGLDRSRRLRAALTNIFRLEQRVALDRLAEFGKRDVRQYLDQIQGMTPFAAARTALLAFDAHAVPVDARLRQVLVEFGAAPPELDVVELGAWLGRQIRAEQSRAAHFVLQSLVDAASVRRRKGGKSSTKKATGRCSSGPNPATTQHPNRRTEGNEASTR